MIYIIDGYNLLWKLVPDMMRDGRLEEARDLVQGKLREFASLRGQVEILIVYDGEGRGQRPGPARAGLRVCFSPGGVTADEWVLDYAQEYSGESGLCVVSSDLKDISRRLGGLRAQPVTSERFIASLDDTASSALKGKGDPPEHSDKPPAPDGPELDAWLEEFGMKED